MFAKRIALEGADRMGKFTQTNLLTEVLKSKGYRTKLFEVPFNDHVTYLIVYWMLKNGMAKSLPNLFQFMQFLNKMLFQCFVLPFYLLFNDFVVFDRWALSAIVYGNAGGANPHFNSLLYKFLLKPHHTIVLTGNAHIKGNEDVYEKDDSFQAKVRDSYVTYALFPKHSGVNANYDVVTVHEDIMHTIKKFLTKKKV